MTFDEYQKQANDTRTYPEYGQSTIGAIAYCALGLAGEAGETANKVKKLLRDGDTAERRVQIIEEIGDTLWYCATLAEELGYSFDYIAGGNIAKLVARKYKGTIHGDGDHR
jgi:NTP pyrophosphatase (non-canonical NTP hydrolase)